MRRRHVVTGLFALTLIAGRSGDLLGQTPEPTIQQLKDSITALIKDRDATRAALVGAQLPIPAITSTHATAYQGRAFILVTLNDPARIRVQVRSTDGTHVPPAVIKGDFKDKHDVEIPNLIDGKDYVAEVQVLQHDVAATPSTAQASWRVGLPRTGAVTDPNLLFHTPAKVPPATLTLQNPISIEPTAVTINIQADRPVVALGRVYAKDPTSNLPQQQSLMQDGIELTTDNHGMPNQQGQLSKTHTIKFKGLEPNTEYWYRVDALDADGLTSQLQNSLIFFRTASPPADFNFAGPMTIRLDPVAGLVLSWAASSAATSGKVTVVANPTAGQWFDAKIDATDPKKLIATVPNSALKNGSEVITVSMLGGGIPTTRQMQLQIGLQEPTKATLDALPKDKRDDVKEFLDAVKKQAGKIDWKKAGEFGLRVLTAVTPAIAGM